MMVSFARLAILISGYWYSVYYLIFDLPLFFICVHYFLGLDTINRQAVLCHRVLRTLQQVAHESTILESSTWESLLLFLLAINDTLLAPPTVKDDVADQLCERVLSVLFEVWLLACAQCFPSPPLWKTLRECCMNWRHRIALIEQWNRVNLALTSKLLIFMYGPTFPELKVGMLQLYYIITYILHIYYIYIDLKFYRITR